MFVGRVGSVCREGGECLLGEWGVFVGRVGSVCREGGECL